MGVRWWFHLGLNLFGGSVVLGWGLELKIVQLVVGVRDCSETLNCFELGRTARGCDAVCGCVRVVVDCSGTNPAVQLVAGVIKELCGRSGEHLNEERLAIVESIPSPLANKLQFLESTNHRLPSQYLDFLLKTKEKDDAPNRARLEAGMNARTVRRFVELFKGGTSWRSVRGVVFELWSYSSCFEFEEKELRRLWVRCESYGGLWCRWCSTCWDFDGVLGVR
ncbi:hypothetical protein Droror1_Dr00025675 [Drosera rotundifolia]